MRQTLGFKYATLVYQAGIANVFSHEKDLYGLKDESGLVPSRRIRLKQADFKTCEAFCGGLEAAGVIVRKAWCNKAGDIINENWNFQNLQDAPFSEQFASIHV